MIISSISMPVNDAKISLISHKHLLSEEGDRRVMGLHYAGFSKGE